MEAPVPPPDLPTVGSFASSASYSYEDDLSSLAAERAAEAAEHERLAAVAAREAFERVQMWDAEQETHAAIAFDAETEERELCDMAEAERYTRAAYEYERAVEEERVRAIEERKQRLAEIAAEGMRARTLKREWAERERRLARERATMVARDRRAARVAASEARASEEMALAQAAIAASTIEEIKSSLSLDDEASEQSSMAKRQAALGEAGGGSTVAESTLTPAQQAAIARAECQAEALAEAASFATLDARRADQNARALQRQTSALIVGGSVRLKKGARRSSQQRRQRWMSVRTAVMLDEAPVPAAEAPAQAPAEAPLAALEAPAPAEGAVPESDPSRLLNIIIRYEDTADLERYDTLVVSYTKDELGGEATILDMLNLFVAAYNERHTPPGYEPPEPPAEGEEKEEKEEGVEDNTPEEWLNAEGMHLVARVGTTDEAEAGVPLKNAELVNQARVGATRAPPRLASLARAAARDEKR